MQNEWKHWFHHKNAGEWMARKWMKRVKCKVGFSFLSLSSLPPPHPLFSKKKSRGKVFIFRIKFIIKFLLNYKQIIKANYILTFGRNNSTWLQLHALIFSIELGNLQTLYKWVPEVDKNYQLEIWIKTPKHRLR